MHLAVAGYVLNDVFREAERLGVIVYGVRVTASGGFNTETWESTGIGYVVDVDSPASAGELDALLEAVDSVAEIPKSIRAGAPVERMGRSVIDVRHLDTFRHRPFLACVCRSIRPLIVAVLGRGR